MSSKSLASFSEQINCIILLAGIFFFNFLSRIILSPLMPLLEKDLGIGYAEAGSFFMLISVGYFFSLMASGFFSLFFTHKKTIIYSSITLGCIVILISVSYTILVIRILLLMLGLSAGLYLPSAVSTLTSLVRTQDWGKTLAIHEMAPTLSFIVAPLLFELLLMWFSWRYIIMLIGILVIFICIAFAYFVRDGRFYGEAPKLTALRVFFAKPSSWIMLSSFSLGIGGSLGVYNVMPLYLVAEHGLSRAEANYIVAFSRVSGLAMGFIAGIASDKVGPKIAIKGAHLGCGLTTFFLGIVSGPWLLLFVFLQPLIAASFFAPGYVALSRIAPPNFRNLSVSFTIPLAYLIGAGGFPSIIGVFGEFGAFSLGFSIVGAMIMSGFLILNFLKFPEE